MGRRRVPRMLAVIKEEQLNAMLRNVMLYEGR